jgi:hypothetical protein
MQRMAGTLQADAILQGYAAAVTRHASGSSAISGAAYTSALA